MPGGEHKITVNLAQTSDTAPYKLWIPMVVTQVGEPKPQVFWRKMDAPSQGFELKVPDRPIRLDIDPGYDLFRTIHPQERPITLSRALGAKRGLIIYPARTDEKVIAAYRDVAVEWNMGITPDDAISGMPTRRAVWLFGRDNRFGPDLLKTLYHFDVGEGVQTKRVKVMGEWHNDRKEVVVLVGKNPEDADSAVVQVMVRPDRFPDIMPILTRKLRHYGNYSYLVFSAPDLINIRKGQWPSTGSPLSVTFNDTGKGVAAKEPPQPRPVTPLAVPLPDAIITSDSEPEEKEIPASPAEDSLPEEELTPKPIKPFGFLNKTKPAGELFPDPVLVPLSNN